jgi:hypothetical protein
MANSLPSPPVVITAPTQATQIRETDTGTKNQFPSTPSEPKGQPEGEGEEEEEFVVEKIVGKRIGSDGSLQYKIKWLGYNNRYNCWVPAVDMNCPDKIADFEVWHDFFASNILANATREVLP